MLQNDGKWRKCVCVSVIVYLIQASISRAGTFDF